MEKRFGTDFSSVRTHHDNHAGLLSRSLNAKAFTHGRDIYFGLGRYRPATLSGKRLIAHELTHVVQQSNARIGMLLGGAETVRRQQANPQKLTCNKTLVRVVSKGKPILVLKDYSFFKTAPVVEVHPFMAERLKKAEVDLDKDDKLKVQWKHEQKHAGQQNLTFAQFLGFKGRLSGYRKGSCSYHGVGLALDINLHRNPYIAVGQTSRNVILRATYIIQGGKGIDLWKLGGLSTQERYTHLKFANTALRKYLEFRHPAKKSELIRYLSGGYLPEDDLVEHLKSLGWPAKKSKKVSGLDIYDMLQWQIRKEWYDPAFQKAFYLSPTLGFMDLSRELVNALVDKGGLYWGAHFSRGKDIMHFDCRRFPILPEGKYLRITRYFKKLKKIKRNTKQ